MLKGITDSRSEIMGIATIGVFLAHILSVVSFPIVLERILTYGNCAVYIFAFLSGFGLYYSLSKSSEVDRGGDFYFIKKG